jgi:LPXTG-site transpeptidase (sortase) family protein
MRRLRLYNLLFAVGIGLVSLGIANAASIVSSISLPEPANPDSLGDEYGFPFRTADSFSAAADVEENPSLMAPSASFLALDQETTAQLPAQEVDFRLLSDLYASEMLYPESMVVELPPPPQPAAPEIPVRLMIPAIELDAPVLTSEARVVEISGKPFQVWHAPGEYAAGWHVSSAPLGVPGNTVLNGHHNIYGEVFKRLVELEQGDEIIVKSESASFSYKITNKMILPEKYAPLEERVRNSQWILPSEDERLTIITCWPYESNTHRLILVARPNR